MVRKEPLWASFWEKLSTTEGWMGQRQWYEVRREVDRQRADCTRSCKGICILFKRQREAFETFQAMGWPSQICIWLWYGQGRREQPKWTQGDQLRAVSIAKRNGDGERSVERDNTLYILEIQLIGLDNWICELRKRESVKSCVSSRSN